MKHIMIRSTKNNNPDSTKFVTGKKKTGAKNQG